MVLQILRACVLIGLFLKWRYANIYLLLNFELFRLVLWDSDNTVRS